MIGQPAGIEAGAFKPGESEASAKVRMQCSHGNERQRVSLGFNQGLQNTANSAASGNRASNLWNHENRELQIPMPLAVTHQALGRLLRCHNARVGDEAAADGVGIVEVDRLPGEIRAVMEQEVQVICVVAGVEGLNELSSCSAVVSIPKA